MIWTVRLHLDGRPTVTVGAAEASGPMPGEQTREVGEVRARVTLADHGDRTLVTVSALCMRGQARGYVSVGADAPASPQYSFASRVTSAEVFRQSPHDPANHVFSMAMQPVPMAAVLIDGLCEVAVGDAPAFSDNYTTQVFDPAAGCVAICSGDSGECPGAPPANVTVGPRSHVLEHGEPHVFRCILFRCVFSSIEAMRDAVLRRIAEQWGDECTDRLGRISVAANYMHYRRNETGRSSYWVVPGIEYSNKQYSRDAFWQSLVLPPGMAHQCFVHEAHGRSRGAERPLFGLIWAGYLRRRGVPVDAGDAAWFLDYAESHTREGSYHSYEGDGRFDFQSWYDLCAFSPDDVITYNQGLLAVALMSARTCGLEPRTPVDLAARRYRELFNAEGGYFPLSKEKDLLSMDVLVGDLLARALFDEPLLPDALVREHYRSAVLHARTESGFKVVCRGDGSYATLEDYAHGGYLNSHLVGMEEGSYAHGGSYFLYDMLFLMDAHLCGAADAEERMIWRTLLELDRGGTTHEHIHTVTGVPHKANQGWNGAIYGLWTVLAKRGKAGDRFLRAVDA